VLRAVNEHRFAEAEAEAVADSDSDVAEPAVHRDVLAL
jgi:hypothetical protein